MTRDMQETDRALALAEAAWLEARGWKSAPGFGAPLRSNSGVPRWSHVNAPKARESYTVRDAIAMTRAEPIRFVGLLHSTGPA